ncbi:MAG: sigma-54-dependent Fis family transcriptional regulator [Tissierellales bacterium]|nr:sigma-54-dependent Fis family transcriptional regulator [Tissierellales bacterium]
MFEEVLDKYKENWTKFVKEGILADDINDHIKRSWIRCSMNALDTNHGQGKLVSKEVLDEEKEKNKELISIALPIMKNLNDIVMGTGFVLVLTDAKGLILEVIGEDKILEETKSLNFVPGAIWSEEFVGTNAIGTCIYEDRPIQIIGAEHYCKSHHGWNCAASPIHNSNGEIIGCLDMSGHSKNAHSHSLGIVVAASYSIENQILLYQSHAILRASVEAVSDGMIIVTEDYKIKMLNKAGEKILGLEANMLYDEDIRNILGTRIFKHKEAFKDRIDWVFIIDEKKIPCNVKVSNIVIGQKTKGMAISFKEMKTVQNTVNLVSGNKAMFTFNDIVTNSDNLKKSIKEAQKFARTKGCVLIEGESGTGKELFAHSIHNMSNRSNGPFVAINCASLPKDLFESELFGYEKGAFTGANKEGKIGKFELANEGTLFLDEIGELPLDFQAKLLRVLDDFTITRIGGKWPKKVDVRIIAATNRDLLEAVRKKNFREDLYYRLNVFRVYIPPLREREGDIFLLAQHFLSRLNKTNNTTKTFSKDFLNSINLYEWYGNVRELENIIERAYYLCEGNIIKLEHLPDEIFSRIPVIETNNKMLTLKYGEKIVIKKALLSTNGDVLRAGELLGMSKSTIYRKLKQHDINPKEFKINSQI